MWKYFVTMVTAVLPWRPTDFNISEISARCKTPGAAQGQICSPQQELCIYSWQHDSDSFWPILCRNYPVLFLTHINGAQFYAHHDRYNKISCPFRDHITLFRPRKMLSHLWRDTDPTWYMCNIEVPDGEWVGRFQMISPCIRLHAAHTWWLRGNFSLIAWDLSNL